MGIPARIPYNTHDCEGIPMLLLKYRKKGTWGYHYVLVSYFLFHFFYAQQNVSLVGNHDSWNKVDYVQNVPSPFPKESRCLCKGMYGRTHTSYRQNTMLEKCKHMNFKVLKNSYCMSLLHSDLTI